MAQKKTASRAHGNRKNVALTPFEEEWDYVSTDGVHAHIARRTGTTTFFVTFTRTGGRKIVSGDYELQTDSKYIPHSIINSIVEEDIASASQE